LRDEVIGGYEKGPGATARFTQGKKRPGKPADRFTHMEA